MKTQTKALLTKKYTKQLTVIALFFTLSSAANAATVFLVNGQFDSTTLTNGNGSETALDQGWYAKEAGANWIIGSGVMTQNSNSGSATRFGQFSSISLTGTGWSFDFDLNGGTNFVRVWVGTLAASPTGTAFSAGGDTTTPSALLVDGSGWTQLLDTGSITGASGTQSFPITQDMSSFDVVAVQVRGNSSTVGATYDNFAFTKAIPEPGAFIMGLLGSLGLIVVTRRKQ